jgi:hypothetical protein
MGKIYQFISFLLVASFILVGCTNQNRQLGEENAQLRLELKSVQNELSEINNKVNELEELYSLRNQLDNQLHLILRTLIRGDYEYVKQYLAENVQSADGKVVFEIESREFEFIIPEKPMNLRQRAYMKQGNSFSTIYEIIDSGYSDDRYKERTYSLNVGFIEEGGQWKLNSLIIDE